MISVNIKLFLPGIWIVWHMLILAVVEARIVEVAHVRLQQVDHARAGQDFGIVVT